MWEKQEEKRLSAKFLACADAISAVSIVNLQLKSVIFLWIAIARNANSTDSPTGLIAHRPVAHDSVSANQ